VSEGVLVTADGLALAVVAGGLGLVQELGFCW